MCKLQVHGAQIQCFLPGSHEGTLVMYMPFLLLIKGSKEPCIQKGGPFLHVDSHPTAGMGPELEPMTTIRPSQDDT